MTFSPHKLLAVSKKTLGSDELLKGLLDFGLFTERIPPCFTSVGLADFVSNKMSSLLSETDEKKLKKSIDECAHDYIRYEALRDINIPRHIGIPHPEAYATQALSIAKHWEEITAHCNKPKPQISRIFVQYISGGRIFEMNYKGSERYMLEELEIQWMAGANFVVKADITSCFPSIYSHSIPWALHGKSEAKKSNSITKTGNLLDKTNQITRDKQTNGLLIGPHSSNIISEIVLTSIDVELQKNHKKVFRHIDDYTFYAETYDEAERFIKDLGMALRVYEMALNDKKTKILKLPRPSTENWIQQLNLFYFPPHGEVKFSIVRSYLDLALKCSQSIEKSTPLNYAIKTLAGKEVPRELNARAKKMYAQEAINLALAYPYLVPFLDDFVFTKYPHDGLSEKISEFATSLIKLGIRKLYPDTIAHALHFALKYQLMVNLDESELCNVIELNDCLSNALLWEYANIHTFNKIKEALRQKSTKILSEGKREQDINWLFIYQLSTSKVLKGNGQDFLAELKSKNFKFLPDYSNLTDTTSQ